MCNHKISPVLNNLIISSLVMLLSHFIFKSSVICLYKVLSFFNGLYIYNLSLSLLSALLLEREIVFINSIHLGLVFVSEFQGIYFLPKNQSELYLTSIYLETNNHL